MFGNFVVKTLAGSFKFIQIYFCCCFFTTVVVVTSKWHWLQFYKNIILLLKILRQNFQSYQQNLLGFVCTYVMYTKAIHLK